MNYRILAHSGPPITTYPDGRSTKATAAGVRRAEWIVDALFGSGLTGALRPPFDTIVRAINESSAHVFAVDIPSGLDCDTGLPLGRNSAGASHSDDCGNQERIRAAGGTEMAGAGPCHRHGRAAPVARSRGRAMSRKRRPSFLDYRQQHLFAASLLLRDCNTHTTRAGIVVPAPASSPGGDMSA